MKTKPVKKMVSINATDMRFLKEIENKDRKART